ncbi:hypothetical protein TELCIR_07277 [Teladorsagia circumcincta]|uniref:G-protein coupled receptors family 1 profile domain-containing protein n=1 Tax=Teladorsagia circumcincta TaxID=45464 RepID=A0A2G9UKR4_TELCI|nr:hypothetical protein TELCIR_07277 [Teladorsagia circumcincta]
MMTVALVVELISTVLSLLCLPINIMFVYVILKEKFTAVYFPMRHKQKWWRPPVYFVGLAILDGIVVNAIVSALYIAIFIRVKTHVVVRRPGELAMRLALSAFIIFISYCTLGIFSVLAATTRPEDAWMYRTLWFVVNDVLCASNAPVLLALNKPIRNVYMKRIGLQHRETHTKNSLINHM